MKTSALLNPSTIFNFAGKTLYSFLLLVLCYWYQALVSIIPFIAVGLIDSIQTSTVPGMAWITRSFLIILHVYLVYDAWVFIGLFCWGMFLPVNEKSPRNIVLGIFLILGNTFVYSMRESFSIKGLCIRLVAFSSLSIISVLTGQYLSSKLSAAWREKWLRPKPKWIALHYFIAFFIVADVIIWLNYVKTR